MDALNEVFFQNALDFMCVCGLDGRFRRVNPALCDALGFSEPELIGARYLDLVHADDQGRTVQQIDALTAGGAAEMFSIRMRRKDLSYCWIEWNSAAVVEGQDCFCPIGRDITERLEAEQARDVLFERLMAIIEEMPEAIMLVSQSGRILHSNATLQRLLGYSRTELESMNVEALVPEPLRAYHQKVRERHFDRLHSRTLGQGLNLVAVNRRGQEIPVDISLTPVRVGDGTKMLVQIVDLQKIERIAHQRRLVSDYLDESREVAQASRLSMCSMCKKVRDEAGQWQNVEHWIGQRYGVTFSGAYCKDCVTSHFPEFSGRLYHS